MKNTLEGINNWITEVEERISDLKGGMVEITAIAQNIEKRMKKKNENSLRDLWDSIKCSNICIIGVSEGEERERTWGNIWRDNSWKLPKHGKENGQLSLGSRESQAG